MAWKNDQVTEAETAKILELAKNCLAAQGDLVELGCYKGDTSLLLAEILRDYNKQNEVEKKNLWIYDSFEGLPEKGMEDLSAIGEDFRAGALAVTKREVKERFLRAGLPVPKIKKAWFSGLKIEDLPEKIAFAFLDGDLYESIRQSLRLVEQKMVSGGVIAVHDYNSEALPGVTKAVDEWLKRREGVKLMKYQSLAIIMI